jgi:hypothetical protein
VAAGDDVNMKVSYHYDDGGLRPSHIQVDSKINGRSRQESRELDRQSILRQGASA